MSNAGQLNPPSRLLLGPGPSNAHPRVLTALATPLVSHIDPYFLTVLDDIQEMLRAAYQTRNGATFVLSATGMAGMETCLFNLLEPGDAIVVCSAGFFGGRMIEIASRTGATVTPLERPWGHVFEFDQIRETLKQVRPKVLSIVQAETSTGVWQSINGLGAICKETDTLLLVDAVTSLGCVPVAVDEWGIDAIYSCSQKGLSCPPGCSPVSFSDRALEAIRNRKTKVQSWYLDVSLLLKYWGQERAYHHTTPISTCYAIREGLRLVLEEGLQSRWERHLHNQRALKAGLNALGLSYTAAEGHRLPQLHAVRIPDGVDDAKVRKHLLDEFNIEIGTGLGEFKGKVWRIGLMGYNSRPDVVMTFLGALEQSLELHGCRINPGAGVAAANRCYLE
jgi:alanine-glyoxylate transaminase/serine-glyoxylate transaminase/serine-pyruvate transaminase